MRDRNDLWYFAYGANMALAVLVRRQVQPSRSSAARLDGYALRFNHPGLPPIEPVFATIAPQPGAMVHGVAHRVTPAEAAILDSLEPGYHRGAVSLHLADGETVQGYAYMSDQPGTEGVPSARYLGLLIDGARENALPGAVIAGWEALRRTASTMSTGPVAGVLDTLAAAADTRNIPADLVAHWEQRKDEPAGP